MVTLTTLSGTKPEAKCFASEEVTTEIFIYFFENFIIILNNL